MNKKPKASFLPVKTAQTPKERFERFVSALIRVPKSEVEKQGAMLSGKQFSHNIDKDASNDNSKDVK